MQVLTSSQGSAQVRSPTQSWSSAHGDPSEPISQASVGGGFVSVTPSQSPVLRLHLSSPGQELSSQMQMFSSGSPSVVRHSGVWVPLQTAALDAQLATQVFEKGWHTEPSEQSEDIEHERAVPSSSLQCARKRDATIKVVSF